MQKIKGILFAVTAAATFGLIPFFSIPLMNQGIDVSSILFYRSLLASLILGALIFFRGKSFKISSKLLLLFFMMSSLYAITAMCFINSFRYISSGISTTLHFLYPIAVAIMMMVFYKEKKSPVVFAAAFLSLLGVGLLCWTDDGMISTTGLMIVGVTILSYSIYIVTLNKPIFKDVESDVMTFYIMLFGSFIFLILQFIYKGSLDILPDLNSYGNILGLVLICTIISNLSLVNAVKLVGSTTTSILGSVEPVVATLVGVLYFHEPYGWNSLFGMIFIFFSVILIIRMNAMKNKKNRREDML